MDRTILHCDCNGFYASVECALHPQYRNVPMAVCGDPESRHGIILAKNELAKAYGIKTAETVWQAKRKCPDLVLAPSHHDLYRQFSQQINAIYQQYTDLVEPFSIDESWLDVGGSYRLFGSGEKIADELRSRIRQEVKVTISVGVSFNKVFAKLGSDYKKPDATTVITRQNYTRLLWPLPAERMLFIGQVAAGKLARAGIHTIGDLARADDWLLQRLLGKGGLTAKIYAQGLDDSPVRRFDEQREVKSVGNSITFRRNLVGQRDIRAGVLSLCDTVAARLRAHKLYCQTVQVQIKSPDLRVISRQQGLSRSANLARELFCAAMAIIERSWDMKKPIRMLTVTGTALTDQDTGEQLRLDVPSSTPDHERQQKLEQALDAIRQRYGSDSVGFGSLIESDIFHRRPDEIEPGGDRE